ncbi:MAG: polyprenyl synthetase family protein [Bacteroidales bacterium]|nr:polyprenyl synthetase family protein [Bacteroidales bacterium]
MIEDVIKFPAEPAGLYDPLRYMMDIGGKRIRPTLCLTVHGLYCKEPSREVLEAAAGIELFHTFSLIHDDIMDRSPLRRGVPTVWTKWDETTAILSGDQMLIEAYMHIAKVPAACLEKALDLFSKTASEVCEGQQYDMDFESLDSVPMAGYEKMIGLKTAVLIACAAKMGALVAGAPEAECEALYRYGYELGMAFQVADDLLDAYGDEKVFGKPIGGDILNEKKSWLTVRALEKSDDPEAFLAVFKRKCASAEEEKDKIARVKARYDGLGVPEDARAEIGRFSRNALKAVEGLGRDTSPLKEFADKLIGRVR